VTNKTNQAVAFLALHNNNVIELMIALDVAQIASDQNYDVETTVWTFDDDSAIKICGQDVEVTLIR